MPKQHPARTCGRFVAALAIVTAIATATSANAQSTSTPSSSEQTPAEAKGVLDEVVVTGTTSSSRTVLTSSVALTVATREDLERKAPRSTAQALELVPGIFVEASGGEVSNNFSVRGLAGGGQQFIQISEDSLPVFYTDALADTILKQELSIDRLEAVRGGTSGVLAVNGAGATINFITRKPADVASGSLQLTTSSFATKRIDGFYTAPISENWSFSTGGFYRSADSVRDTGFTADEGGILRAAVMRKFDGGRLILNVKVVDDHNTFLTPIPLRNSRDPEGIPGLSATSGTLIGPDVARFTVRTTPTTGFSTKDVDLHDGVDTKATAFGYDFETDVAEQFNVFARGRYTDFDNKFNANFSYDNASLQPAVDRLNPALRPDTALLLSRFPGTRAALRVVATGEILSTPEQLNALNGNGLVAENVTAINRAKVQEFASDSGVRWETDDNSLTVGVLYFHSNRYNDSVGASTYLSDVRDNSRRLDVVALNAAGQVVGSLTENSLLNYGTFGEGISRSNMDSTSVYANNELRLGDKWRVDAGVRYEFNDYTLDEGIGNGFTPIDGTQTDNIIANDGIAQFGGASFSGNFQRRDRSFDKLASTIGVNYLLTPNFAIYGRYARGFQAQGQNKPTDLNFAEGGIRYQTRHFQASLTAFRTVFKDFLFSRQPAGAPREVFFTSDIDVYGGEFDVRWTPLDWFRIQANGVIQDSKLNIRDDQGTGFAASFDGNAPERTPPVNITVTPSILLPDDRGEIYVTYRRIGRIYSDLANSIRLPGYGVLSAGVLYNLGEKTRLAVSVDNITNTIGLTEGNPRAGFIENTGSDYFFARPILGRNAIASVTVDF
jgi:outer membrane receptor protein involved in Fe transport